LTSRLLPALLFCACLPLLAAETVSGKVIAVADGDTLTILTPANERLRVRLDGIDAPERRQPFGKRSGQALSDLCFGKVATVGIHGYDRYQRALGRVSCEGVPANARQVETGMAWVFRRYSDDPQLLALEEAARAGRRGVWSDLKPVPPWEYRSHQ
jgi:endonuclease YncB( thermonuclease family)